MCVLVYMCVPVIVCVCTSTYIPKHVRRYLAEVHFAFLSYELQRFHSVYPAWLQAALLTEPSHQPIFVNLITLLHPMFIFFKTFQSTNKGKTTAYYLHSYVSICEKLS